MKKIKIKKGCYYARRSEFEWEKISNFTIKIKHKLIYGDEVKREITFKSGNKETKPFTLEPKYMATTSGFKAYCLNKGDYIFEGKGIDLNEIWKREFRKKEDEPKVYLINEVGCVVEQKIWLFKNLAIKGKRIIVPDDNGVFWINEDKGLKIKLLSTGRPMPKLKKTTKDFDIGKEVSLVENALNENIGGFNGSVMLGYIVATVYSRFLFKKMKFFPLLFVYGKYQSGKNIFCELVVKFIGLNMNYATSAQENSQTGTSRLLNYYAYLPVWIDEYRNSDNTKGMSGYYRNVYNKVTPVKAKREESGIRDVPVKGNLILSGEEMPIDPALRNRCFPVNLKTKDRNDSIYNKVQKLSKGFSKITFFLIKNINRKNAYNLLEIVKNLKQEYMEHKIDARQAEVFAVVAGGRKFFDKFAPVDIGFDEWLVAQLKSEKRRRKEESPVTIFWETVEGLISKGAIIKEGHIKYEKETGKVYVWFAELYRDYEKDMRYRRNETIRSRQAILDQLAEESYFIKRNVSKRIGGCVRSCVVLNLIASPRIIKRIVRR